MACGFQAETTQQTDGSEDESTDQETGDAMHIYPMDVETPSSAAVGNIRLRVKIKTRSTLEAEMMQLVAIRRWISEPSTRWRRLCLIAVVRDYVKYQRDEAVGVAGVRRDACLTCFYGGSEARVQGSSGRCCPPCGTRTSESVETRDAERGTAEC